MIKTTIVVDGMMCGMCEAHVCDAIRKAIPSAKKVAASNKKGNVAFISENEIDKDLIKKTIAETGNTFVTVLSEPYKKNPLFEKK